MSGHLLARRRALLEFAVITVDQNSKPETLHAAAVRALEAAFIAEFGLSIMTPEETRLLGLIERFKNAFQPAQTQLFEGGS
jgi:hypothetical protein